MQYTKFVRSPLEEGQAFSRGWILQFMIERLLSSDAPSQEVPDEDEEENRGQHEADQYPEYYGLYHLCRKDPAG